MVSIGELSVGMNIAIHSWKPITVPKLTEVGLVAVDIAPSKNLNGLPMKVIAINLPFIVCNDLSGSNKPLLLDTRDINLMEVTEDYIKACCNFTDKRLVTEMENIGKLLTAVKNSKKTPKKKKIEIDHEI